MRRQALLPCLRLKGDNVLAPCTAFDNSAPIVDVRGRRLGSLAFNRPRNPERKWSLVQIQWSRPEVA